MSTIVKNIHILKDGVWRPISKVFHQGEWKKMKGIFYDGVWYEIGSTCVVMPPGCAIATNEHPRWNDPSLVIEPPIPYGGNNFKFNAIPGGHRIGNGMFFIIGNITTYWISNRNIDGNPQRVSMGYGDNKLYFYIFGENAGHSIRAVKTYSGGEIDGTIVENDYNDGDNNTYNSVVIGNQLWTMKNLYTTKYQNGSNIPNVTNNNDWRYLTTGAYCWYNNDYYTYGQYYGALYNWYAVDNGLVDYNGYRVPTKEDWEQLIEYLTTTNWCGGIEVTNSNVAQFLKSCRQVNHPLVQPELRVWISGLDFVTGNDEAYIEIYINNILQHTYEFVTPIMEEPDIYNVTIGDTIKVVGTRVTTSGTLFFYNYAETYERYEGQNTFTKTFTINETYTEIQTGLEFL